MSTEETKNAEAGSWDSIVESKAKKSFSKEEKKVYPKVNRLKLDPGTKRTVRLVGTPISCYRFWNPISVITDLAYGKDDPMIAAGFKPDKRWSINVIDQADMELKVLEGTENLFHKFAAYKADWKKEPAITSSSKAEDGTITKPGVDTTPLFVITTTGGGDAPKKFEVTNGPESKITQAEKDAIRKAGGLWKLKEIFKAAPLSLITALFNKLSDAQKIPPEKPKKAGGFQKSESKKVEEKKVETPSVDLSEVEADSAMGDKDLFENPDGEASDLF